jgi:hypothetical protein
MTALSCSKNQDANENKSDTKVDLSTAESAGESILAALKNGDMEAFRQCLSPRLQKKVKECEGQDSKRCKKRHSLKALFTMWKRVTEARKFTAATFSSKEYKSVKKIDGKWRLDDS